MTALPALAFLAAAQVPAPTQPPQIRFRERVDVERVLVDARVVDRLGRPIVGLGPADFRVSVGDHDVLLESVLWVPGGAPAAEAGAGAARPSGGLPPVAGRLIVFLFQKDLERSRIGGLMRMLLRVGGLLDTLVPGDRVAVLSFDSHLRLWVDFTDDRGRVRRALARSVLHGERPPPAPTLFPSLADHFDAEAARRAAAPETALLVLAEALRPLPGAKSLVFFGWGMGTFAPPTGVHLDPDYEPARRALLDSRTAVFALDVTDADYHTLEVGLQLVAEDTGGFYARTHLFPGQALRRLEGALAGHYVLVFEQPRLRPGLHDLRIRLVAREGTVLARPAYEAPATLPAAP